MFHPKAKKVVPYRGKLYPYNIDPKSATNLHIIPENEVIIANGVQRPVVVFNKTLPGPDIIVYEGQTVIIHVTNKMRSEVLSVHWHGLYQRNTPFMDGVPFITQCPILPGQTFTYKFQAYPKGTFWYYSTTGLQRIDGASGALIVRPRGADSTTEHILQVQEWYDNIHSNGASLLANLGEGTHHGKHLVSPDGAIYHSIFIPTNALINGKGEVNELPFYTFKGHGNNSFLFRTMATGTVLPFKISIDGHKLKIIEANGYRVKSINVDSVILNPGERIVFTTNRLDSRTNNFWIRATTIDVNNSIKIRAIIRYDENEVAEPKTSPAICSSKKPCKVFNCPFKLFPVKEYMECITADKVDSIEPTQLQRVPNTKQFKEYFFNFEFPGTSKAAINGKQFLQPTFSALTQPNSISTPCNISCGGCKCTNSINLNHNDTVHFVLTNMGTGKGWGHPVHLHGHSFELLKMGFPTYERISGNITTENEEIRCISRRNYVNGGDYCTSSTWSDLSWANGNAPGLNLVNPPLKDTVVIPRGGYVVIRIRANNPGLWLLHSLCDYQTSYGMSLMLNESFQFIHQPPSDFPKCGNFDGIQTPLH